MTRPLTVSEAAWQDQVEQLAAMQGWHTMHVRRSRVRDDRWATATSVPGWPDLFLWHPDAGRAIAIELKSDTGRLTPDQIGVLRTLTAAGVPGYIARPQNLDVVMALLCDHHAVDRHYQLSVTMLHPERP